MYSFANREIATDGEGFLLEQADWSAELAEHIASLEGISLTPAHWQIIHFVQAYYAEFKTTPAMRLLVKNLAREYGPEIGSSRHLQRMFNQSPAKTVAKLAGLPKPAKCL